MTCTPHQGSASRLQLVIELSSVRGRVWSDAGLLRPARQVGFADFMRCFRFVRLVPKTDVRRRESSCVACTN